jgi:hypothetical protein
MNDSYLGPSLGPNHAMQLTSGRRTASLSYD